MSEVRGHGSRAVVPPETLRPHFLPSSSVAVHVSPDFRPMRFRQTKNNCEVCLKELLDVGAALPLQLAESTQWSTTLSSKVNLPHTINVRALCAANLVTRRSKFEPTNPSYSTVTRGGGLPRCILQRGFEEDLNRNRLAEMSADQCL